MRKECHSLRPGAYAIGAVQLGNLCRAIEDLPEDQFITEGRAKIEQLIAIHRASCAELIRIRNKRLANFPKTSREMAPT